jgi:hypothetical protein
MLLQLYVVAAQMICGIVNAIIASASTHEFGVFGKAYSLIPIVGRLSSIVDGKPLVAVKNYYVAQACISAVFTVGCLSWMLTIGRFSYSPASWRDGAFFFLGCCAVIGYYLELLVGPVNISYLAAGYANSDFSEFYILAVWGPCSNIFLLFGLLVRFAEK